MLNIIDDFINLCRSLSPSGRAFRMPEPIQSGGTYVSRAGGTYTSRAGGTYVSRALSVISGGIMYRLYRAIGQVYQDMYNTANDIKYVQLPDNDYFTIDDANEWYVRLGLYNSGLLTLPQMKSAILQKLSFSNELLRNQNYLFIQEQLNLAGFTVYINENRDWNGTQYVSHPTTYYDASAPSEPAVYGGFNMGMANYGGVGMDKVVNYIESDKDRPFIIGNNWSHTFFIGGVNIGDYADVPASREIELRQLILKLKRADMVAILFINYV
jgi:hypothetical protein